MIRFDSRLAARCPAAVGSRSACHWLAWLLLVLRPCRAEGPTAARPEPRQDPASTPRPIELSTARDRQSIVVQAEYDDGSTRDVTAVGVGLGRARRRDRPGRDRRPQGRTARGMLKVDFAGLKAEVPVEVRRASAIEPLRFRNDVMPVLTKAGCNTGKCHGVGLGQGRVPALALRLRPRRRSLPPDPRGRRPAGQPRRRPRTACS